MIKEDNNGFVFFPMENKEIVKNYNKKTIVYIVAFSPEDASGDKYVLSNINIDKNTMNLISDDITNNQSMFFYFKNDNISINLTTCICVGWSDCIYEINKDTKWVAKFKDLTHEGKRLYYSIKKLHNNKEIRILTFNE
jgi:hypothetical protein